tara:strand:+ start:135 stop:560 length:426 start_codon:yes stop_codon:yes gene_type:complete
VTPVNNEISSTNQKISWLGTLTFLTAGFLAMFISGLEPLFVITSLVLFGSGLIMALRAFTVSIARSRYEMISTADLVIIPKGVQTNARLNLYGSLATQVTASIAFAATQSSTNFAFGILASVFALGNVNIWAISNGTFKKR